MNGIKNIIKNKNTEILIIMNSISLDSNIVQSLSGGDRILIELLKRWDNLFNKIEVLTCNSGIKIIERYIHKPFNFKTEIIETSPKLYNNLFKLYLFKLFKALQFVNKKEATHYSFIYSSSDFWPDSIPAFFAKLKNPTTKWIAGFYLFAPAPWKNDSPYKTNIKRMLVGIFYWITQIPIYFIVKKYADIVFVTSEPDVKKFITKKRDRSNIIVIQGGVDITDSEKYLNSKEKIPLKMRRYDACFVGRFHDQKGVLLLIDIWKLICKKLPEAKLAMIGVGPLQKNIEYKIKKYKLEKNIDLLGFKDGKDKYEIFKQSKIIIHPATYDSGGMAAAEGMAWGLPGVSFDLEALKTYYPKGMIKIKLDDIGQFAKNVLELLNNCEYYNRISMDAHNLIVEFWDWEKRSKNILEAISKDNDFN